MAEYLNLTASIITLANAAYWSFRLRDPIACRLRNSSIADTLLLLQVAYYIEA